jgi:endothelin-converting enzyme
MSLKDADKLAPQINVAAVIKSLAPRDIEIDRVIVMAPSYMRDVSKLISETPAEIQHIYLLWKVVQAYYASVEADALTIYKQFLNEINGKVSKRSTSPAHQLTETGSRL